MIAAQVVHAVGESLERPHEEGTYAVVLAARDELHLALIAEELERKGVRFARIRETDPPYSGQLMALGLRPGRKEALRRYVSSLPLLK
jgi:peptidyl-tRNA hydrolase